MKSIILAIFFSLLLAGCITGVSQRTPITGGAELKISADTKVINASGNTKVVITENGAIQIETQDDFNDLVRVYNDIKSK